MSNFGFDTGAPTAGPVRADLACLGNSPLCWDTAVCNLCWAPYFGKFCGWIPGYAACCIPAAPRHRAAYLRSLRPSADITLQFPGTKYAAARAILAKAPPSMTVAIQDAARDLDLAFCEVEARLVTEVYDPRHRQTLCYVCCWQGDELGWLIDDGDASNSYRTLTKLRALKKKEAQALMGAVNEVIRWYWTSSGHATKEGDIKKAIRNKAGPKGLRQAVPPECVGLATAVALMPRKTLSDKTLEMLGRATKLIKTEKKKKGPGVERSYTHCSVDDSCYIKDDEAHMNYNGGSGWLTQICSTAKNIRLANLMTPVLLTYAEHLLVSKDFHEEFQALFGDLDGVRVVHAPMKKFARAKTKATDANEYGSLDNGESYVKDILRISVLAVAAVGFIKAFRRLEKSKYPPLVVKNRIGEDTHDVLTVVRFCGLLVEIQFHMTDVVALKALSHAPYNATRTYTDLLAALMYARAASYPDHQEVRWKKVTFPDCGVEFELNSYEPARNIPPSAAHWASPV